METKGVASSLRKASADPHAAGEDENSEFTVPETFHAANSLEDGFFPVAMPDHAHGDAGDFKVSDSTCVVAPLEEGVLPIPVMGHSPEHVNRTKRPNNRKRERYQKVAQQLLQEVDANPQAYDQEKKALAPLLSQMIPKSLSDNEWLMKKLNQRLQKRAQESAQRCSVGPDHPLPSGASPATWLQPVLNAIWPAERFRIARLVSPMETKGVASILRNVSADPHAAGEDENGEFTVPETFHAASSLEHSFFPVAMTDHVDGDASGLKVTDSTYVVAPLEEGALPILVTGHSPEHVKPRRPSNRKRERYQKLAQQLLQEVDANPQAYDQEKEALAPFLSQMIPKTFSNNEWLMKKLNRRLQKRAQESAQRCSVGPDHPLPSGASPAAWLQPVLDGIRCGNEFTVPETLHAANSLEDGFFSVPMTDHVDGDASDSEVSDSTYAVTSLEEGALPIPMTGHSPEHVQRPKRPNRHTRERYRKLMQQLLHEVDANPLAYDQEKQALAPFLSQMIPKSFSDIKWLMKKLNRRVQKQAQESAQRCSVGPDPPLPSGASPAAQLQPVLVAIRHSQGGQIPQVGPWKFERLSI